MARPMFLIKRTLLEELHSERETGVPMCHMIRKRGLGVTHPTLSKLLSYMRAADKAGKGDVRELIYASLFPVWLCEGDADVALQPGTWRYEGRMPLGKWVENTWAKEELSGKDLSN